VIQDEKAQMKLKDLSEELLNDGYAIRIKASGLSMFPSIWTGDRITISPQKDVTIGDVIVFNRGGQIVAHKLVRVFEKESIRYYQTRGDSSFRLDQPITAGEILGKVTGIKRERLSLARRVLLFIYPALRFGRLNAALITGLIRIRRR
jgi:SOS-response transcriptional repressor LexA